MSFVHDEEGVASVRQPRQVLDRSLVAVHAVEALDRNPDPASAAASPPITDGAFRRLHVVMREGCAIGPAQPHSLMAACVNELVMHDEVAPLRQRREQAGVGRIAVGEEEGGLRAEEAGGLGLEFFVFWVIAAEEPGSPEPTGTPRAIAAPTA